MSFRRYSIELAFPEPVPLALMGKLKAMEATIHSVIKEAVKINAGKNNEENTTKAIVYTCRHGENAACGPETEI